MKKYIVTEQIESPNKVAKGVEVFDFLFVGGYCGISWGFMNLVHTKLHIPFMIFSVFIAVFLTVKSSFNKRRRNYESLFLMIQNDIAVYRPFYESEKNDGKEK